MNRNKSESKNINTTKSSLDMIDINIKSLEDILNLVLKSDSDIFVFEPRDNDIKIIFRN